MRIWITVPEGARAPLDDVFSYDSISNVKAAYHNSILAVRTRPSKSFLLALQVYETLRQVHPRRLQHPGRNQYCDKSGSRVHVGGLNSDKSGKRLHVRGLISSKAVLRARRV